MRYIKILLTLLIVFSVLFFIYKQNIIIKLPVSAPQLEIYYLDVGQGDSIYIKTPNQTKILIDGGSNNQIMTPLSKVRPFWEKDIDIMILTHPHADHLVGEIEVLQRLNVKRIYYTGVLSPTADYLEWLKIIHDQKVPLDIIYQPQTITLDADTSLQFLYPTTNYTNIRAAELNETSIVARLIYKQTKFLFTGDAGITVEEELLKNNVDLSADVLKIGHHGSTSASSEKFLQKVNPEVAVIQVGRNNDFDHPHLQTLRRLERQGVKILRTDQLGTIKITSDGNKIYY